MPSHILIIDDDTSVLEMMRYAIEGEGYQVTTSLITFEDVKEVERLQPDLIILDLKLRGRESGWKFLQRVRLYPATSTIPVIICTAGLADAREQEDVLRTKGVPILYKPFGLEELHQCIKMCLKAAPPVA